MNARDLLDYVGIIPLLPLFGATLLLIFGRRIGEPAAGWIATGLMALAFLASLGALAALLDLPSEARLQVNQIFTWIPAGTFSVHVGTQADPLSITWLLLVTGVGTLIHLYSIGYMHGDPLFSRFFAYLNLFAASMLVLVVADNLLLTFLGWEGVGLCSYLLISFWYQRNDAAVAGKKAFVTNRVGDVGFLLAMFLIIATYGSLEYTAMSPAAKLIGTGTCTAIALLLMVGAMGKSAQIPLHVWLTDAMEGPTPVSALIHAATMVTAGVFLMCRAFPFLEASADASTVVMWVGAITALLAGTVAVMQPDIKRALAYSTISQLGYMFLAVGIGGYTAAVFMVLCHAFYKGCLFLGAGSVIHGNGDNQDMRIMGRYRKFLPVTAFAMVIAWLSIAGIPPFSGFWAKDEILVEAYGHGDYGVWIVGTIAALVTAVYMTRLIFLTFYGNARYDAAPAVEAVPVVSGGSDEGDAHGHAGGDADDDPFADTPTVQFGEPPRPSRLRGHLPHESPAIMLLPIVVLSVCAALAGLLNLPIGHLDFLHQFLEPVFRGVHETEISTAEELTAEGLSVLMALTGLAIAVLVYKRGLRTPDDDPVVRRLRPVSTLMGRAYYWDDGISAFVGGPGEKSGSWLDRVFDTKIVDGAVNGTAWLVQWASRAVGRVQDGFVRRYALGILLGTVAIVLFVLLWAGR
ncbi:MAG: NADH-quinone oxidoreductase subunit L [Actinomycetota bacterium]